MEGVGAIAHDIFNGVKNYMCNVRTSKWISVRALRVAPKLLEISRHPPAGLASRPVPPPLPN